MTIHITETERQNIETLYSYAEPEDMVAGPQPGERCVTCGRRRNKPRKDDSPASRELRIKLPTERMESVEEAFDVLQEITGVDPYSYPKGTLLEVLLLLGGQHREELAEHFRGES